jgi:sulfatase maturation enzyme AslB (radical SAM superfamily)
VSAAFPLLEEADTFRPVQAAGRPIFRWDCGEYATFYAPGCLCVVGSPDAAGFEDTILPHDAPLPEQGVGTVTASDPNVTPEQGAGVDWGAELWRRAELAGVEARRQQEEPFSPECLTLYMNNECNLGCVYCHTDPSPGPAARLDLETIAAAAEVVAENCRQKGHPFYGVFHGGGEPTLHRERVEQALSLLARVASAHGVELFRYVATNGVMSEEKAAWLARHFDLIGLSCDGPAEIQNNQRPRRVGTPGRRATSHIVERTGRILREEGCRLHVRTTITGATLDRQAEVADYICRQFSPEEIHFEPVYLGGRTSAATGLSAHQAGEFVAHFLQAREIAREHGVLLMSSGSRPDVIHGPYCNVFRDTLNLVPGGVATACFEVTDAAQVEAKGVTIGALNRETGRFEIDHSRVQELRQRLGVIPADCASCFNRYHCVRECPDRCPLDDDARPGHEASEPGFRCRAQKALAYATLREAAEGLWSAKVRAGEAREKVHGTAILRSILPVGPGRD